MSLLDPDNLVGGWCHAPSHLPNTSYKDVKDYLMKHDAEKAYKNGKSSLELGHLSGIKTNNIDINVRYRFVRGS